MPPRRKPTSTRQKKADQQLKRAIKRGDVPPPEVKKNAHHRKPHSQRIGKSDNGDAVDSARKLQSAFVKLPPKFLEDTKFIASNLPLCRPVPDENAVFHRFDHGGEDGFDILTCPKRPKWRFDMSKLEVEQNEEGQFKKWLAQTDEAIEKWQNKEIPQGDDAVPSMPRSPTYFERNLEVWRQLYVSICNGCTYI